MKKNSSKQRKVSVKNNVSKKTMLFNAYLVIMGVSFVMLGTFPSSWAGVGNLGLFLLSFLYGFMGGLLVIRALRGMFEGLNFRTRSSGYDKSEAVGAK